MHIILTYPWYFVLLAIIVAAGMTALLYVFNSSAEEIFSKRIRWILASLRFLALLLLLLLLLNPLVKRLQKKIVKPLVVIAQDNSSSIDFGKDSVYYHNAYVQSVNKFKNELADKADVAFLTFGQKVTQQETFDFSEKFTCFDKLFQYIDNYYNDQNLAAVVVASDGIMNYGNNPLYETYGIKAPVHTLALGDTAVHKDLIISNAEYNTIVLKDNPYPLVVHLEAVIARGNATNVNVFDNGKLVSKQTIDINQQYFLKKIPFLLTSSKIGIHTIDIKADTLDNEIVTANNQMSIKIEVIDAKENILILAGAPHPDIGLLQRALKSDMNFNVKFSLVNDFAVDSLLKYNLIILYQLPTISESVTRIAEKIREYKKPVWYFIGTQTDMNKLNQMQSYLKIVQQNDLWDDASATQSIDFQTFSLPDNFTDFLDDMPPLSVPYGQYKMLNDANIVLKQKVKNVETSKPLLVLFNDKSQKAGFLLGENIWHWGIYDFKDFNTKDHVYQLICNMAHYLSLRIKKNNLTLNIKSLYYENQPMSVNVQFYNEILEQINDPDISLKIKNTETDKVFEYKFMKTDHSYYLNINDLFQGNYSFEATTKYQGKVYIKTGEFSVVANNIESVRTRADFTFLNQLAEKFNGHYFDKSQIDQLKDSILAQSNFRSISKSKNILNGLIDWKLICFIIIGFLAIEWFFRKYFGNY